MQDFFNFVWYMFSGFIDTVNQHFVITYTTQYGQTFSVPIFWLILACLILSIVVSYFVKGAKG